MGKSIALAALTMWLVVSSAVDGYGQLGDIRDLEQAYFDRVTSLKANIAEGWTPAQVVAIMGTPDRRRSYFDGPDLVEVWGYRGYEVLIEFRNGLASYWFFRFMR